MDYLSNFGGIGLLNHFEAIVCVILISFLITYIFEKVALSGEQAQQALTLIEDAATA